MALGFAAWGLISAFAPTFRSQFNLSAQATAFLVAVPVLLGSLARLPIGVLTDRFGGRIVFTALFLFVAVAAGLVPRAASYDQLLVFGFLLGVAGASFAVCVFLYRLVLRIDRMPEREPASDVRGAGPWRIG
jgi:NNP family nitrate/nitrite transporter-like MFS transporter